MTDAKTINIGDVMTKSVISVNATLTINETAKMMDDAKVGAVIIMENNVSVGIVTDRDFSVKVAGTCISNYITCKTNNVIALILN